MKVYVKNPPMSHAMDRVTEALIKHSGSTIITETIEEADLVILHVIGFPETESMVEQLRARRQKYAIIQYCIRTTQRPDTRDWLDIWKGAELVWTYYDLEKLYSDDMQPMQDFKTLSEQGIRIYRSPLGVDSTSFRPWPVQKTYLIGTSGYVAESEGVLEANAAVNALGGRQFHLGPPLEGLTNTWFKTGINDKTLAQLYSQCNYVAGLRRGEGFELPAAEAILCGTRPICFDQPHYRDWYKDWAVYIKEGSPDEVAQELMRVLATPPLPFSPEDLEVAKEVFNWERICRGFWSAIYTAKKRTFRKLRKSLLWVGDAAVSSGFARSTHGILDTLKHDWDVHVLGINYFGDPHPYDYPIYPVRSNSMPHGDMFGIQRLPSLVSDLKSDLIVLQNDPWNIQPYMKGIKGVPAVGYIAVDGLNCRGRDLNGLRKAIFWTKFAEQEARKGGCSVETAVIPLGVDLKQFRPMDKMEARRALGFPDKLWDAFIFLNVNRNQPRKRMDLCISYFAQWLHTTQVKDAFMFFHVAPTGDAGYDIKQLGQFYGIANRLIISEPEIGLGVSEEMLVRTYCAADVSLSTTQGEGMGLTTLEAMACGIPFMGPDWAALGDWAKKAMLSIPCSEIACTPNNINAIGGIADRDDFVKGLDRLYREPELRDELRHKGLSLVSEPQYRWEEAGAAFARELDSLFFTQHSISMSR